jgi:hypothetical protein
VPSALIDANPTEIETTMAPTQVTACHAAAGHDSAAEDRADGDPEVNAPC